jgi:5-methylcytosine-specific restriction endonuclease McrA
MGVGSDMETKSSSSSDIIAKLVPGGAHSLAHLSDDELLANTRRLVGKSNHLFAALLVHLAEVEARGIHRTRRCASLYTYCIYELRFSEDAAARRSSAARLVKQFPLLFDAIANGELHLTGLLMLGPHLTPENHVEVLARAKFRTKKELAKLVRELNPLPEVPDLIEPLGPTLRPAPRNPTWEQYVQSLCPPVRELAPGERPRDWANDGVAGSDGVAGNEGVVGGDGVDAELNDRTVEEPSPTALARELLPRAPAGLPPVTGPQQYQMQFSTTEEHVRLVERAKGLLARERPGAALGELHVQAMRLLVAALEKKKFAVTDRPRRRMQSAETNGDRKRYGEAEGGQKMATEGEKDEGIAAKPEEGQTRMDGSAAEPSPPRVGPGSSLVPRLASVVHQAEPPVLPPEDGSPCAPRRRGSRYVPAAERREVFRRDGGRCSYVDSRGERCGETHYLELHHLKPFARGGANVASNLTLRCAAHNALAAEEDFGRERIVRKRDSLGHESCASQARGTTSR